MKLTIDDILRKKKTNNRIVMVTAYDYSMARICDSTDVDILLVGDSAATVMMGYDTTRSISMEEMLIFCKAVRNGTNRALIVGDMPFGSYQVGPEIALSNAVKFIKCGCDAVKLEGGYEIASTIKKLSEHGIPVMGHIGLKPQTASITHGFRLEGTTTKDAVKLIQDAKLLEESGAFSIVLEKVTAEVAQLISIKAGIPIIGIASGPLLDGQVLVLHDLLGLYINFHPKFIKRYLELFELIGSAIADYCLDVRNGTFPNEEHTYHMENLQKQELEDLFSSRNDI
ncbi:MAG TPA: 3-methyl-2-oxobutanoate hydroxymethyltransferase [Nitrososphaeraceae archaeon]